MPELGSRVSQQYEECRQNLEHFIRRCESLASSLNEATTRLQLIDTLFLECLAWDKDHVVCELAHGGEYADYTFSTFRPVLIVEAKREGNYFELPAGTDRLEHSLSSLMRDLPTLRAALKQASGYCQSRGVPYGVVTNGRQVVAFVAARNDGVAPLDGRALVFASPTLMRDNFLDLWQALSRPGMEENRLKYRLIGGLPELPRKLSATLNNYPGLKARNLLQTDLQILSEIIIEDLTRSPELESKFLKECYCQSGALSQFALTSKAVLAARYSALFDSSRPGPSAVPATTKSGTSSDLLAVSLARRPILLLGDVGVGKTSFIRHLIKVEAAGVFASAIALHLDLGLKATLSIDLRLFVLDEIESQLRNLYDIDIRERNFVRGVYDLDLKRFAAGIHADLKTHDPGKFLEKEIEYLEGTLVGNKSQHLKRALEHVSRGRKKQIVLFLDNADQRDERTQELAFLIAQEFAETWPAMVFVALRPETFHRSRNIGALTGYHAKAFTISPPRIDLVIEKRLRFALKIARGEIPVPSLDAIGIKLENLPKIIDILLYSIKADDRLMEFIDNISAGNVRLALDFVKAFIGSGHVDTQKMLDILAEQGSYNIAVHEFLRAVIYGDHEYYDPNASVIANLFDLSSVDGKEHFLVSLLLGLLQHAAGPDVRNGFVDTGKVYEQLQGLGFVPDQIDVAIARAAEKNLIETSARRIPEPGQRPPQSLRVTTRGAYHFERLASQFQYVDAVVVDTPILLREKRVQLNDARTLGERLARAETFAAYLDEQWLALEGTASGFNWCDSSSKLKSEIAWIRRTRMGH
jgi:GTPase SAR1 family protein